MTNCAFCGRENETESRFCIDCGKLLHPSAARVGPAYVPHPSGGQPQPVSAPVATPRPLKPFSGGVPSTRVTDAQSTCPRCGKTVNSGLPFCGHCGTRVVTTAEPGSCAQCGATYTKGLDLFCARCGCRVGARVSVSVAATGSTQALGIGRLAAGPKLALLGEGGAVTQTYTLDRGEAVIGRGDADIQFADDHLMSPLHARLELREGQLWLRDLGSRNGTWLFIEEPARLTDLDLILVGSQLLRFRRLGYPGPHPPEADSTRRMGSVVPTVDIAVLEQLRADGSVRDVFHLSPGRSMTIGRESGDWLFPYDGTMSGRHADVRSEDNEFFAYDATSRNGVAMGVRGDRTIKRGQRILVGDQILRLESV